MEMYSSSTCSRYERDDSLPQDFHAVGKDTCLTCKHSIKCSHDGEVDIMPCGKPSPINHSIPSRVV